MSPLSRSGLKWSALAGLVLLLLSVPTLESRAQMDLIQESTGLEKIEMTVGKSVLLRTSDPIKRASVADLEVANFNLLSSPWDMPRHFQGESCCDRECSTR